METLSNLECFVRAAEASSFSEAARRLGLSPAAVSRNVAMLERNLGARLFQRSTRRLRLTEAGERLLAGIGANLDGLQAALADVATGQDEPGGVLKLTVSPIFGLDYLMPLLPAFLARYPRIKPEWHFENRQVDLIGEGYDVAIGGGFGLNQGMVARTLAPVHLVAVAAPAWLAGRALPRHPRDLAGLDAIGMRFLHSGRMREWHMRTGAGEQALLEMRTLAVLSDPQAVRAAALLGMGVAVLAMPDVLAGLAQGTLVRLLPDWYVDAGSISLYYPSRALLPAKTRAFVDFVVAAFERDELARKFSS
ncbi:LysR family transcriptional regulator [uncultured Massilia sp.]|uniref:LysR family transcriptional regulator n=1 Tax=uncultured Massilia sp. TaxID=169973 RepID=UPI0025F155B1|nr:LysR family transcriptional regulator [uncultured Massilia sp.]